VAETIGVKAKGKTPFSPRLRQVTPVSGMEHSASLFSRAKANRTKQNEYVE